MKGHLFLEAFMFVSFIECIKCAAYDNVVNLAPSQGKEATPYFMMVLMDSGSGMCSSGTAGFYFIISSNHVMPCTMTDGYLVRVTCPSMMGFKSLEPNDFRLTQYHISSQ